MLRSGDGHRHCWGDLDNRCADRASDEVERVLHYMSVFGYALELGFSL